MTATVPMSDFARTIYKNKYAHQINGRKEEWPETAERVARAVLDPYLPALRPRVQRLIEERKFMPGGRYLYACGRRVQQVNSCFLFRAEDNKEGWGELANKAIVSLMTGGGVGVVYSDVRPNGMPTEGMGGMATGPTSLACMINEQGRYIRQGGSRRSALWGGLHWWHPDIFSRPGDKFTGFIDTKNWHPLVREGKRQDFNFPAPLDMTNISVILDDDFFTAYHTPGWKKTYHRWGTKFNITHEYACDVYWTCVRSMLKTGEPGFSVDIGPHLGENLRNAPVHGDTKVLTKDGYWRAADLAGEPTTVWTGKRWAEDVLFRKTGEMKPTVRVTMTGGRVIVCEPSHPFMVETWDGRGGKRKLTSVERVPAGDLEEGDIIQVSLPEPPTGPFNAEAYTIGFIYGDGSFVAKRCAEVTICHESKGPCADRFAASLGRTSTTDGRGYTRIYFHSNPVFQGRDKEVVPSITDPTEAACWLAGLFDADGNADPTQKRIRLASVRRGFIDGVARMLETLGVMAHVSKAGSSGYGGRDAWQLVVSADHTFRFTQVVPTVRVKLNLDGYKPYRRSTVKVLSVELNEPADVYCADVKVEEHSFCAEGVIISNCTEVTSRDDCDMCNLGSVNISRYDSLGEFAEDVPLMAAFLLCGTLASVLPVREMHKIREKNRRVGLGMMGLHEWLLKRGYRYEMNSELRRWMEVYANTNGETVNLADRMGISRPIATRSIAPTGTISIIAETTSGIEPVLAVAQKRRYLDGSDWKAQYIVDPTAHRLIESGVMAPDQVEDSMTLAEDVERRIRFQAEMQAYVDHGISSTINLPPWNSPLNGERGVTKFGNTLLSYLPQVRGITTYPDGSRDGQPLTPVPYEEAVKQLGVEFIDQSSCNSGVCGS